MYWIGRTLQFAGLVVLPLGMVFELQGRVGLRQYFVVAAFGGLLFLTGYVIQGVGNKK